jgi:hypothetical protein
MGYGEMMMMAMTKVHRLMMKMMPNPPRIQVPCSLCVVAMVEIFVAAAMEAAERQSSAEAAAMECVLFLGSSSLYIDSRSPPMNPWTFSMT